MESTNPHEDTCNAICKKELSTYYINDSFIRKVFESGNKPTDDVVPEEGTHPYLTKLISKVVYEKVFNDYMAFGQVTEDQIKDYANEIIEEFLNEARS